jgi:hypothetical protein
MAAFLVEIVAIDGATRTGTLCIVLNYTVMGSFLFKY